MNIVFFDIETTGFEYIKGARMTEIAWAKYDTDLKRVVGQQSWIINAKVDEVPENITKLTGITLDTLRTHGKDKRAILNLFFDAVRESDAIFARNGIKFDWPFICCEARESQVTPPETVLIDDYIDIKYPPNQKNCTLSHVAADHGFLNPFPHQAMGDVMTMIRVMEVGGYDLELAFGSARHPMLEIVSLAPYAMKDKVKAAGFNWDPERGQKGEWFKNMRGHVYENADFGFPTRIEKEL